MKKTLAFMVMALALLLTQCKKPSITFPTPSVTTTVSMTITAGPGSKTDISTMGGIVWSENDKIYVGDGSKYVGCLSIQSGVGNATGTFTGDVTVATGDDCTFHFYYLGHDNGVAPADGATEVTIDFSSQDIHADGRGNLTNASKHHVGYGKAEHVKVEADKPVTGLQVSMKSKVAIAYFCFQKGEGESVTPYKDALTLSGEHIYNKMTVKFNASDFYFTPVKDGDISLTNTTTHLKYAMLVPTNSTAEEILNFGGGATGATALENGIEANKFYRIDGNMPIVVNVTASAPTHETVNFGTPNLNWSKYNLGVDPENLDDPWDWYGDYYAWGEVRPYYTSIIWTSADEGAVAGWCAHPSHSESVSFDPYVGYDLKNYLDGNATEWDAALDWEPYGTGTTLAPEYDAATAAWGEGWRMPTSAEWQSLYDNNTFEVLAAGSNSAAVPTFTAPCDGHLVVKGKDASLDASVYMFLPAAGYVRGTQIIIKFFGIMPKGYYWSSSLYQDDTSRAYNMDLYSPAISMHVYWGPRSDGHVVRPVR